MSSALPVAYRFGGLVIHGRGFAAEVRARGRAVADRGPSGFHLVCSGAGGIQGRGEGLFEAFADLRGGLTTALFAAAAEADGFEAFATAARALFAGRDEDCSRRFEESVAALAERTGAEAPEALPADEMEVTRLDVPGQALHPKPTPADALIVLDRRSWRDRPYAERERRAG